MTTYGVFCAEELRLWPGSDPAYTATTLAEAKKLQRRAHRDCEWDHRAHLLKVHNGKEWRDYVPAKRGSK